MPKLTPPLHVSGPALALGLALVLLGCAPAAGPGSSPPSSAPSGSHAPSAVPSAATGAIDHPTGATDVILRLEEGGGFVPIDFLAAQAPTFTLYGNGVIVFQRLLTNGSPPDPSGLIRTAPWRTAKLDEAGIQELLEFALGPGGLGAARESYVADGIADAGDTIFTIRAGGLDKVVTVNALMELTQPGSDAAARAAFSRLAQRLRDIDRGGTIASDVYWRTDSARPLPNASPNRASPRARGHGPR